VLPFFLASIDRGRQVRWAVVGCMIVAVALVAVLTWNSKLLPARVYFPLLSFPLSAALLSPAGFATATSLRLEGETKGRSRSLPGSGAWKVGPPWARAVVVLLIVGVVMGVYRQGRRSVHVNRERRALETFLAGLQPPGQDLYVCWESAMPFELVSPLDNLHSWSQIPLVNLVWTQRTPWQEEIKRRFGISCFAQAMFERDNIVLVATAAHRSLFVKFAKEHFGVDIEFVESESAGEKFVAGRFHARAQSGESASKRTAAVQR
jgi:hypothetical protein